jgi:hypothetical protein
MERNIKVLKTWEEVSKVPGVPRVPRVFRVPGLKL